VHHAIGEGVGVGEDAIGLVSVAHVFLNAEIWTLRSKWRAAAMQTDSIGGAVTASADVVEVSEAGDFSQMGNSAGVDEPRCGCNRSIVPGLAAGNRRWSEDFTDG